MGITAIVENDIIKLPMHVPDGTRVEITLPEGKANPAEPGNALAWMKKYAGCIEGPEDFAAEHDHYIHGTPKADAMSTPARRLACGGFIKDLPIQPNTVVRGLDNELLARGLRLYRSRPDKEWSLTDCISFVVMGDEGLTEALTGDRHFEQAGFTALLA